MRILDVGWDLGVGRAVLHHGGFSRNMRVIDYCCIIDAIAGLVVRIFSIVLTSECLYILGTNIRPEALLTIIA